MALKVIPIAIIEDSINDADRLKEVWSAYCQKNNLEVKLDVFRDGESFLKAYKFQYDLIFMDIDLPKINGIDTSEELRKKDNEVTLVIISNSPRYAIDGYSVNASDFILKPISGTILNEKMKRLIKIIQYKQSKNINIALKNNIVIKSKDILYIEVIGHNIVYHTNLKTITCRGTLKEAKDKLKSESFFRINYSILLNLDFVMSIDGYNCHLTNGETLYISRNRKKDFNLIFSRFLGGTLWYYYV